MRTHTDTQIIKQNGMPTFAVIDWDKYQDLLVRAGDKKAPDNEQDYTPHKVMELIFSKNYSTIKAWRVYLGFTQQQLADKLGLSQAAIAKIEKNIYTETNNTISRLATAMGLTSPKQLLD